MVFLVPLTLLWLASSVNTSNNNKNAWLSQRLEPFGLELHEFPTTTGRGLRTTRDRAAGEIILQVKDAITCDTIFEQFQPIRELAEIAAASSSSSSCLTQEQVLALGLLEMKHGDIDTELYEYVQTLPTEQYSVMTLPKSLQRCLPRCYQTSVDASKATLESLHDQIVNCAPNEWKAPSFDDFCWAFCTVRSRSISAEELTPNPLVVSAASMMMLPGLDLLNHDGDVDVSLEYLPDSTTWQLSTQQSYTKNEEVFLNYGNRDNLKMLFTYGFCCPSSTESSSNIIDNNLALFDLQDLLQASLLARPTIFTAAMIPRIEPQLQTAVGGEKGESRAMFSHSENGPRDSLLQGMGMMQQVATQLSSSSTTTDDDDDNMIDDLRMHLTNQRMVELQQGLKRIQKLNDTPEEWHGVQASIEMLLQAESKLLLLDNNAF